MRQRHLFALGFAASVWISAWLFSSFHASAAAEIPPASKSTITSAAANPRSANSQDTKRRSAIEKLPEVIRFNRDVRPILSDACFQCHGPDKQQIKGELRLDEPSLPHHRVTSKDNGATIRGGSAVVVAGHPEKSELIRRVFATDPDEAMPPKSTGRILTAREKAILKKWVQQGGKWEPHWAFVAPVRPTLPTVTRKEWPRNPIDTLVLARLEQEGLAPAPEADRPTLIRRVTLDLTGLPPTPEEVDTFVQDRSPRAYENVVDRLLASPRFGERMASRWLDAARYADTSGYQTDGEREMWRWRDWVIDAYNADIPFDRFTIDQLAGDLLPNPTLNQQIATAFNRNHRINSEGGIVPEEYAVEYVVDRVETTSLVWLGLTAGCARCHDHKFDPLTQKEFFQLYAYFNSIPEKGRALKLGNSPPYIKAPTQDQQRELTRLNQQYDLALKHWRQQQPEVTKLQSSWEKPFAEQEENKKSDFATAATDWTVTEGLVARFTLDGNTENSAPTPTSPAGNKPPHPPRTTAASSSKRKPGAKSQPSDKNDTKPPVFVGAATPVMPQGIFSAWPLETAPLFDGQTVIVAGDVARFGYLDKFTLSAWVLPEGNKGGTILSRMADEPRGEGYSLVLVDGKLQLNLSKRWLDDALRVESRAPLRPDFWTHVLVSYDGSRMASGIRLWINGVPQPLKINIDDLNQTFATDQPLRIGGGHGPKGRFHGLLADVRVYNRLIRDDELASIVAPTLIHTIASLPATQRTRFEQAKLTASFVDRHAPVRFRNDYRALVAAGEKRAQFLENLPTLMVMQELSQPRPAHLLIRGQYNKPGDKVARGVPAALPPFPTNQPQNRLGLAHWVVDPRNPLTARVIVNRYWQMLFGTGLVRTVDDFGSQGEIPSHPELLDWLALEFQQSSSTPQAWSTKQLLRQIVLSATYRQSSRGSETNLQRDPENRLMSRGPRIRLSAEMIRDQALAASGLLVERQGGPSVKIYQPDGLWKELADTEFQQDHGPSLYRRSLYTFIKRTVQPPMMMTFDASGRETCVVRETRTNTPLQALILMNEVSFVEAARKLAERVCLELEAQPAEARVTRMFRLVLGRHPSPQELRVLLANLRHHQKSFQADPQRAAALLAIGESPHTTKIPTPDLAAHTATANLILNLDEAVTRE